MKTKIFILIVVAIIGIIFVFQHNKSENNINIGAVLSLSGSTSSFYGEYNKNSLEIAKDEINNNGGILGKRINIIYENSTGDKQIGASGMQKLINVDKVNFVISDITAVSLAIAPIAEANKKILIATSASTPDLTKSGDYIFRTKLASTIEGKEASKYIYDHIKPNKIAFLYQNSDYGTGVFSKFSKELSEKSLKVFAEQKYETGSTDMRQQILNIKNSKPDLVIVAGFPKEIGIILKQSHELGLNTKLFAHSGSIGPDIDNIAGKQADGLTYLSELDTTTNEYKVFSEKYFEKYGKYPELFSSNAYDSLMLLSYAIVSCKSTDTSCVRDELYKTQNYKGVSGSISYDKNGDLKNRNMVCKKKIYIDNGVKDVDCK